MKKLILLILLLPSLAWGQVSTSGISLSGCSTGAGTGGLTCSGATQQAPTDAVTASGAYAVVGRNAGEEWQASRLAYGGTTGTLCQIILTLKKTGSPTGTLSVYIYSDNTDTVGSVLATCGTMSEADLTTSNAEYTFASCNLAVTNGTDYWIVLTTNRASSTANYTAWSLDSACATEDVENSADGTTWGSLSTSYCGMQKLYILE